MSKQHIIFLKDILLSDYENIEEVFTARLLEDVEHPLLIQNIYDKLPLSISSDVEKWPKSTNLLCWNCDYSFITFPVYIPIFFKDDNNILVKGNFCGFTCAAGFIRDYLPKKYMENIQMLFNIKYKKNIKQIYPARNKYCLKKYGGSISEEEYINEIKIMNNDLINENDNMSHVLYAKKDFNDIDINHKMWDVD